MQTLYESERFCLTHVLAEAKAQHLHPSGASKSDLGAARIPTLLVRYGFEIVDKASGKEVYLDGSWAEMFQRYIQEWQHSTPTQEEVETILESYAQLAQTPVLVH